MVSSRQFPLLLSRGEGLVAREHLHPRQIDEGEDSRLAGPRVVATVREAMTRFGPHPWWIHAIRSWRHCIDLHHVADIDGFEWLRDGKRLPSRLRVARRIGS